MNIILSGETKTVPDGMTIAALIQQEQIETPDHVRVAVNDDFIAAEHFTDTKLQEGDGVEILMFMGGGR